MVSTSSPLPSASSPLANAIRALSMDAVEAAKSGHPGMPMGMADAATVLFTQILKFDPAAPNWPDRDRFVLSAGHGSMLLYALLYLTGYEEITLDELRNFRQIGARTAGHPEYGHAGGIETTTGPLGQGLGNAVGMAIAERHMQARFGDGLVDHYTYCIAGDGCLMEGISHEAASLAGHLGLGRLIVLFDDNGISIDGPTSLATSDDQIARFQALGWDTASVDGHDPHAVAAALTKARKTAQPSLIACKTTIGFGAPTKAGTSGAHGAPLGTDEIAAAREALNWPHAPFVIPDDILTTWRKAGSRGAEAHKAWRDRLDADSQRAEFNAAISGSVPKDFGRAVQDHKAALLANPATIATRVASQNALAALAPSVPELLGGSADLTGSNNTRVATHTTLDESNPGGDYLYYGVREHGMAAAMNGMALHGGVIPYGGTFLVFADYCRPSIRLAALMGLRVIYVMTHDSIGLGEDGPTHQPVEHLASLRAIPGLLVMRPADAVETAECWEVALSEAQRPSLIALTRQGCRQLREPHHGSDGSENLTQRGGYVLAEAEGGAREITLVASGSEVALAYAAQAALAAENIRAAVVSMPCMELFFANDAAYRHSVIDPACPVVAVEAGLRQSWDRLLGEGGRFVGMEGFGASGPGAALYKHFGITAEAVIAAAKSALKG